MNPNAKNTALAIALSLLAGTPTFAQASEGVSAYGVVDIGVERSRMNPGPRALRLTSGLQWSSRLGLKGSEDLGGGWAALFRLESGFDASTGEFEQGGRAFGRQAWVGLQGPAATFRAGRQYTALIIALGKLDPFDLGLTGDASGMAALFHAGSVRMDKSVSSTRRSRNCTLRAHTAAMRTPAMPRLAAMTRCWA